MKFALVLLPAVEAGCQVGKLTCYADTKENHVLDKKEMAKGAPVSQEYCAQLCADANKAFAGLVLGTQCYCGDAIQDGAQVVPDTDCDMECNGDGSSVQFCGGYHNDTNRMSVYEVSCSGEPEPVPALNGRLYNPCLDKNSKAAKMPWCNSSLSIDERVEDMISRMSATEKICSLGSGSCAVESLDLKAYNWWSEATHGLYHVLIDDKMPYNTNFAFPITTAMSFNRSLWHATGQRLGLEARGFMNVGNAGSTFWAPVINLAREPRWGRNLETPGEDPYLSGEYATEFVQGFERNPADPEHIQASACCKHYVANEMEGSTVAGTHWDRRHFDAQVSQQDLMDSYMVPFQACVEKGQVTSLMCSYNALNGVPACANNWLLQDMARDTWKFDGYIASDCDAALNVWDSHNYTTTPEESVRDVLRGGMDIDCSSGKTPSFVRDYGQSALDKGVIEEKDLDDRLRKAFRVRMRLSHFDPKGPLDDIPASEVCSEASKTVALEGAIQSASMVKNAGVLPLDSGKVGKVAVIGPLYTDPDFVQKTAHYYGGGSCENNFWTMQDAVSQYVNNTVFAQGVADATTNDTSKVADAVALASDADVVVLAIGTDISIGEEGKDAPGILLSSAQQELVDQVAAAAKHPVIVAAFSHNPFDMSSILKNDKVGAVLYLGQPSVQVLGVGDVLFGQRSPAGRMVTTVYPASYGDQISIFDFNMRPGPSAWPRPDCPAPFDKCENGTNPGRTHRFYTAEAVVPFGFGLSYSTWQYTLLSKPDAIDLQDLAEQLQESDEHIRMRQPVEPFQVEVANAGKVDADDVVLAFAAAPGAGADGLPKQELVGFERVHVKAGDKAVVTIQPELSMFSQVNEQGKRYPLAGEYKIWFGLKSTQSFGMGYAETTVKAELGNKVVVL